MDKTRKLSGFLLINKPMNQTSFSCVGQVRRLLGDKRLAVGHAGTLDSFATGLLIMGVGRSATSLLGQILQLPKTYIATGKMGELTDTHDPSGQIVRSSTCLVTADKLQAVIANLGSTYYQVPPVYSALKHQGRRLSDLSRSGKILAEQVQELAIAKTRLVHLYRLQLLQFNYPEFKIQANVSAGTYIRSLVNDLAEQAGSCATTMQLSRTQIGPFNLNNALDLSGLNQYLADYLIPVDKFIIQLADYSKTR